MSIVNVHVNHTNCCVIRLIIYFSHLLRQIIQSFTSSNNSIIYLSLSLPFPLSLSASSAPYNEILITNFIIYKKLSNKSVETNTLKIRISC